MNTMTFILAITVGIVSSNFNFLSNDVPGQITMEYNCLPDVPFFITKAKPTPDVITKEVICHLKQLDLLIKILMFKNYEFLQR